MLIQLTPDSVATRKCSHQSVLVELMLVEWKVHQLILLHENCPSLVERDGGAHVVGHMCGAYPGENPKHLIEERPASSNAIQTSNRTKGATGAQIDHPGYDIMMQVIKKHSNLSIPSHFKAFEIPCNGFPSRSNHQLPQPFFMRT